MALWTVDILYWCATIFRNTFLPCMLIAVVSSYFSQPRVTFQCYSTALSFEIDCYVLATRLQSSSQAHVKHARTELSLRCSQMSPKRISDLKGVKFMFAVILFCIKLCPILITMLPRGSIFAPNLPIPGRPL